MEKICTKCKELKALDEFPVKRSMSDGRDSWCKRCCSAASNANYHRRKNDPGYKYQRRLWQVKRDFGLTQEQFEALGDRCAGCGEADRSKLCVDHDHDTGRVRGLLCRPCNLALGHAKEDAARLRALADYIEKANACQV